MKKFIDPTGVYSKAHGSFQDFLSTRAKDNSILDYLDALDRDKSILSNGNESIINDTNELGIEKPNVDLDRK